MCVFNQKTKFPPPPGSQLKLNKEPGREGETERERGRERGRERERERERESVKNRQKS